MTMLSSTSNGAGGAELPLVDDRSIWDLWLSRLHLPAVCVADEIGLFSQLAKQPANGDTLAQELGIHGRGAEALLGVLAGLGFVMELEGRFHLAAAAREYLLPESPYYWGGVLAAYRAEPDRHGPVALRRALREKTGADAARASSEWDPGALLPERALLITRYMHAHSAASAAGFARSADLASARHLLDLGAGSGCFSLALARRHPTLLCTLFDLREVCEIASATIRAEGFGDRVNVWPGSFFRDAWPRRARCHSSEQHPARLGARAVCALVASRVRIPAGGRAALVHEMLLGDARGADLTASSFSLQTTIGTRGKQPTAGELRASLTEAGFARVDFVHSFGHFWMARALKA